LFGARRSGPTKEDEDEEAIISKTKVFGTNEEY
jgi:hypothetical protein